MNNKSQFFSTREDAKKWLDECGVCNYIINDDLSVDVNGNVNISYNYLKIIPIKFGKVTGHFYCSHNELTNLIGSPESVDGSFWCDGNKLKNLIGSPKSVGDDLECSHNQLITLAGSPERVEGDFWCQDNKLTNLIGSEFLSARTQKTVASSFEGQENKIKSLESALIKKMKDFRSYKNKSVELTNFLKKNIGGTIVLTLDKKIFKDKELYNFLNKYFNKQNDRVEIEFKILKFYLEKLELEKNLKDSDNIKLKKITKKSYL